MGTAGDTIVAARVPLEIKEQGNAILTKLGFTPTQLINSAYRYVMEYHQLPFESAAPKSGKRRLDPERLQELVGELTTLQVCSFDYSQGGTRTLKELLSEQRQAEYEMTP